MKKVAVKILELACVVAICFFLVYVTGSDPYSEAKIEDVEKAVTASMNTDGLSKLKKNKTADTFAFDFSGIEGFSYYACDEIMDVREILIIKLKEDCDGEEILAAIEKRASEKQTLFEGYAPVEGDLLKNRILKKDSGYIFYAVGEDAAGGLASFLSAIK